MQLLRPVIYLFRLIPEDLQVQPQLMMFVVVVAGFVGPVMYLFVLVFAIMMTMMELGIIVVVSDGGGAAVADGDAAAGGGGDVVVAEKRNFVTFANLSYLALEIGKLLENIW